MSQILWSETVVSGSIVMAAMVENRGMSKTFCFLHGSLPNWCIAGCCLLWSGESVMSVPTVVFGGTTMATHLITASIHLPTHVYTRNSECNSEA